MKYSTLAAAAPVLCSFSSSSGAQAFQPSVNTHHHESNTALHISRRNVLETSIATGAAASLLTLLTPAPANAAAAAVQDSLSVNDFLRTGVDGGLKFMK